MTTNNPIHLISEEVHLNRYPEKISDHPEGHKICIGDLHANPVKLLYFLIREGIINLDKENYESFYQDYCSLEEVDYHKAPLDSDIRDESILKINHLTTQIQSITKKSPQKIKVTLIGDVLADRGYSDALMIELLFKMHALKIDFEIISSNHDLFFLEYWQSRFTQLPENIFNVKQGQSLERFHYTKNELGYDDEILEDFMSKVYLPRLKLLSYDLTDEGIVVYSHAPMRYKLIELLAKELMPGFNYKDNTAHVLASTIDIINATYIQRLTSPLAIERIDVSKIDTREGTFYPAIRAVHWTRVKDMLGSEQPLIPDYNLNYQIRFVYGHDGQNILYANGISQPLDTLLGKLKEECNQGTYLISFVNMSTQSSYEYERQKEMNLSIQLNSHILKPTFNIPSTAPFQESPFNPSKKRARQDNAPQGEMPSTDDYRLFDSSSDDVFYATETDIEVDFDLLEPDTKKLRTLSQEVPDVVESENEFLIENPSPVIFGMERQVFQNRVSDIESHLARNNRNDIKMDLEILSALCENLFSVRGLTPRLEFKSDVNLLLKHMQELGLKEAQAGTIYTYNKADIENILNMQLSLATICTVYERIQSIIETHELSHYEEELLYPLSLAALESFRVGHVLLEKPETDQNKRFFKI